MIKILSSYIKNLQDQDWWIKYLVSFGVLTFIFLFVSFYFWLHNYKYLFNLWNNLFDSIGIIVWFLLTLFGLLLSNSEYSKEYINKVQNDNEYRSVRKKHWNAESYLYFYKRMLLIEVIVQVLQIIVSFITISVYISTISCENDVCNLWDLYPKILFYVSVILIIFLFCNTLKIIALMVDFLDRTEFYKWKNLSN